MTKMSTEQIVGRDDPGRVPALPRLFLRVAASRREAQLCARDERAAMKKPKPEDKQRKPPALDDEDEAPAWSFETEQLEGAKRMKSTKKAPTHKTK
jgi:hypothetical protein